MTEIVNYMMPSEEAIRDAALTLSQLSEGFLPEAIFLEIARLRPTAIVELVPLRTNQDTVEVLLTRRPADDPNWPNMLHTPGTALRATDVIRNENYTEAFARLFRDELGVADVADGWSEPQYVENRLHHAKRGVEDASVYYVEVTGQPVVGEFYDVSELPVDVVDSQIGFIMAAVQKYKDDHHRPEAG